MSLPRLRADLERDLAILTRHVERLRTLEIGDGSDEASCSNVALGLHYVYTAVENILKRIAAEFEGLPSGDSWHRDLLAGLAKETSLRPRVLSANVAQALSELLAFRHYLIHGSVIALPTGEKLAPVRQNALDVAPQLEVDLKAFLAFLSSLSTNTDA